MKTKLTLVIGSLLILIFGLFLFMYQVRQTEVAVVTRFGKPVRDKLNPGAYFKLPWPVENVHWFEKRVQNFNDTFEQTFTQDQFTLLIQVYAGWSISDPKIFFPRLRGSTNEAVQRLHGLVRNAKNAVVGMHPLSHFISTDTNQLQFAQIEKEILQRIQQQARVEYGIDVKFLGIQKLGLPESVTKTVFDRMRSEREVLITRIRTEGEQEASRIRATAERESRDTLSAAEAEAAQARSAAEAQAAKFYEVFQENPGLALLLLELKALESSITNQTTLILGPDAAPFNLLQQKYSTGRTGKQPTDK